MSGTLFLLVSVIAFAVTAAPVSYTQLDVYKRQVPYGGGKVVSGATGSPLSPSRLSRKGKGTAVMLTGEYQHNMDLKGRVTVPSKFREDLGDTFYVCKGLDGCLFVLSRACLLYTYHSRHL